MFQRGGSRPLWQAGIGIAVIALLALANMQMHSASSGTAAPSGPRPLAPSGAPVGDKGGPGAVVAPMSGPTGNGIITGTSYKNDVSPALRDIPPMIPDRAAGKAEHENPPIPLVGHKDVPDTVAQRTFGAAGV